MMNAMFMPSNEPFQQGVANVQNSMMANQQIQRSQMVNDEAVRAQQRRRELEAVLASSSDPERAGYEWAKRNDPQMYGEMAKLYFDVLTTEAQIDPDKAVANFNRRTGEGISFTGSNKDWVAVKSDDGQTYMFNIRTRESHAVGKGKTLSGGPGTAFLRPGEDKPFYTVPHKPEPSDKSNQPYEDYRTGDPAKMKLAKEWQAGSGQNQPYGQRTLERGFDENGNPVAYWSDPVNRTLVPAKELQGIGRTEPRDIAQSTQAILQGVDLTLPVLDELEKQLKQLDTGPLRGRLASYSMKNLGSLGLGDLEVQIRQKMGRLTADQIFGEGGKQLTSTEKEMVGPYVLGQEDTLQAALAKLPELKKRSLRIKESRLKMMNTRTRTVYEGQGGGGTGGNKADSLRKKYNY